MAKKPAAGKTETGGAQRPSVGRVVHYYEREEFIEAGRREVPPEPQPAMVRRVLNDDGDVDLVTFGDLGPRNVSGAAYRPQPTANCWTWPPYVPAAPIPAAPAVVDDSADDDNGEGKTDTPATV